MAQKQKAFDILCGLGEARRNREDWPDYKQYGIGRDDVEDLLNLVTDGSLHDAPSKTNEVWVPLHAWRALGQLADPRAIEHLIGAFDSLWEDDWALAELPVAVAMLGQNGIRPLTEFLNDSSHAEFARAMAVEALIWLPTVKLQKGSLCCKTHRALLQGELGDGAGLITTVDHADIRGLVTA